jgi:SAM-dependent methyltransferase
MLPKPKNLAPECAAWFNDPGIVEAYPNRPPYPPDTFDILEALLAGAPRTVLDVGCGTGDIARYLAPRVERIDAVDPSPGMLAHGQRLPHGDHPRLNWILSAVEEAPLTPLYGLITAGESLHWMDWYVVLPRFAEVLAPGGFLALIERDRDGPDALRARLRPIFSRYSANRDYRPFNLVEELTRRDLFEQRGEQRTQPALWQPTVDEYIMCRHSQNGFSRDRMDDGGAAFDTAMRDLLADCVQTGVIALCEDRLQLAVTARVIWGKVKGKR